MSRLDPLTIIHVGRIGVARRVRVAVGVVGFTVGAFLFGVSMVGAATGFGAETWALVAIGAFASLALLVTWWVAHRGGTARFDAPGRDLAVARDEARAAGVRAIMVPLVAAATAGPLMALLIVTRETLGFGDRSCLRVVPGELGWALLAVAACLGITGAIGLELLDERARSRTSPRRASFRSPFWLALSVAYAVIALTTDTRPSNLAHVSIAAFGALCWAIMAIHRAEQPWLADGPAPEQ